MGPSESHIKIPTEAYWKILSVPQILSDLCRTLTQPAGHVVPKPNFFVGYSKN